MYARSLALIVIVVLCLGVGVETAKPTDFTGFYTCVGNNPNGSQYALQMRIRPFTAVLSVDQISQAGEVFSGIGYVYQDRLLVAFSAENKPSFIVYVHKKHQLSGIWGMAGLDKIMTEICTPSAAPVLTPKPPLHDHSLEQV